MSSPALPRAVARALTADPPRLLVVGGAYSGKSALLDRIRRTFPDSGEEIRVVDDAHRLPAEELLDLSDRMFRDDRGIIVATEPRPHRTEVQQLVSRCAAHACIVTLQPSSPAEILSRAAAFGISDPRVVRGVLSFTGGSRDLVDAALTALRQGADPRRAAVDRVRARLAGTPSLAGVLALVELGGTPDPAELSAVLDLDADLARELADAAQASGLLSAAGDELVPAASGVPSASLGPHGFLAVAQGLLSCRLDRALLTVPVASRLAATGITDRRLADYLVARADSSAPAEASALYSAAVRAGADASDLALRRAEAAAAIGDRSTAAALTDEILERAGSLTPADLATAVRIAATVAAGDGMLGRSADLYEWLGPDRAGADASVGAAVLLAAGRPEAATRMIEAAGALAPTSSAAAARLLAEGMRESIGGDGRVAMNALTRALSMRGAPARAGVQPDTVEAITALLCLHSGELTHASNVLARYTPPTIRHELLAAWAALLGGDLPAATAAAEDLSQRATLPRDLLFLHGLRVGAARRSGDSGRLLAEWEAAQGVVAAYSVDLVSLLPLGELWLAAVRVGDAPRISHLVGQARDLLAALGEPPLWGAALHWYGVQAAIAAECPDELLPHARALAVAAESTAYAAALARAGQQWLRLLQNDVDPARIRVAAESLAAIGLTWDGARLAGEAALRATDTAAATALLQVARALRQPTAAPGPAVASADTVSTPAGPLSEREAQVADLVVSGLTYREVGARLYISGKTVEHHVARIRRRLGAGSRSELISMLRAMGHGGDGRTTISSSSEKKGGTSACP
ncbi:LuxR C-terminal-related transcriptional regulator [Rhodococcus phenolicus]|uniref:LuxR C-terminal-related transcriptional regulator n=1 Tax=Rhodococcus phenolicus TaxID=263849 RepID=UPI00082A0DB3|nr:LuxR C-terminal-related transcriptional regulator [Rhodococcus phenolicus]